MVSMSGADAEALDALAQRLEAVSIRLVTRERLLGRSIHASPWEGRGADRFRSQWSNEHSRSLIDASAFLRSGSDVLRRNAEEQRAASESGGGMIRLSTPSTPAPSAAGDPADELRKLLEGMGLSVEQVKALLDKLGTAVEVLEKINKILENEALQQFLDKAGSALGVVDGVLDMVSDFLTDFVEHAHLPVDEALVHAIAETGVRFAVSEGAQAAVELLTPVIMSVVPVVGTATGWVVGKVVGFVVGEVVDAATKGLESTNFYNESGDVALDGYRYMKERDFDVVDIATDGARDAAQSLAEGAQNLLEGAQNAAEGAKNFVGNLF